MARRFNHPLVDPDVTRKTSVPKVISYSKRLSTTLRGDKRFAGLVSLCDVLDKDTTDLETAQGEAGSHAKGTAPARDTPLGKVHTDIDNICQGVQQLVDAAPGQAEELATAAAMHLRKSTRNPKAWLAAKMVKGSPGAALLKAKQVKRGSFFEWQISSDGTTWTTVGWSTVANMPVSGLVAGHTYYFRYRTTLVHTTGDWTQALTFMAH